MKKLRTQKGEVKDIPTAVAQEQHYRARVSGWSYARHIIVTDDSVSMEIARTHCSHCATCRARIAHCEQALGSRQFSTRSAGGGEYFVLPLPAGLAGDAEKVSAFLAGALNLRLQLVAG